VPRGSQDLATLDRCGETTLTRVDASHQVANGFVIRGELERCTCGKLRTTQVAALKLSVAQVIEQIDRREIRALCRREGVRSVDISV
jgi:hypothetical protein